MIVEFDIKKRPGHLVMFKELPENIRVVNDRHLLFFKIYPGEIGSAKIYRIVEMDNDNITKVEPFAGLSFSSLDELASTPLNYNTFWDILSLASKIRIELVYITSNPHIILDMFSYDNKKVVSLYFPPFYFDTEIKNNKVYVKCCNFEKELIRLSSVLEVIAFVQTLDYIDALEIVPSISDETIDVSLKLKKVDGDTNGIITTSKVIETFEKIVDNKIQEIMTKNQVEEYDDEWKRNIIIKNIIQETLSELRIRSKTLIRDELSVLQKFIAVKVFLRFNRDISNNAKVLDEYFGTNDFSRLIIEKSNDFISSLFLSD